VVGRDPNIRLVDHDVLHEMIRFAERMGGVNRQQNFGTGASLRKSEPGRVAPDWADTARLCNRFILNTEFRRPPCSPASVS
jgi:hypothetical protein